MKLTMTLSSFTVMIEGIQIEWDQGKRNAKITIIGLDYHEQKVIQELVQGTNRVWVGSNDPSCCYSLDLVIENIAEIIEFPRFRWERLNSERGCIEFKGRYGGEG